MSKRRKNESTGLDRELERYSAMDRATVSRPSKAGRWLGYGAASAALVVGSAAEAALIQAGDLPVTLDRPEDNTENELQLDLNNDSVADFALKIGHAAGTFTSTSSYTSIGGDVTSYSFMYQTENVEISLENLQNPVGENSGIIFVRSDGGNDPARAFQTSESVGANNYNTNDFSSFAAQTDDNVMIALAQARVDSYSTTGSEYFYGQMDAAGDEIVVGVRLSDGKFGWIRLDFEVGPGELLDDFDFPLSVRVLEMSFEASGAHDHVTEQNEELGGSSVPEPGSGALVGLGLLAMGAGGIRRLRQRREAQPAH